MLPIYALLLGLVWVVRTLWAARVDRLEARCRRLGQKRKANADRAEQLADLGGASALVSLASIAPQLAKDEAKHENAVRKTLSVGMAEESLTNALQFLLRVRCNPAVAFLAGLWLGIEAALAVAYKQEIVETVSAAAEIVRQIGV